MFVPKMGGGDQRRHHWIMGATVKDLFFIDLIHHMVTKSTCGVIWFTQSNGNLTYEEKSLISEMFVLVPNANSS